MALIDGRLIDDALAVRRRLRGVEGGEKHARPAAAAAGLLLPDCSRRRDAARAHAGCRPFSFRSFSPLPRGFVCVPCWQPSGALHVLPVHVM